MCVFVKLWHWTSGPGWRPARCVCGFVSLGGIDGCPRVLEGERYVCMSWKQLFPPPSNDYLCSLWLIYGHTWSLHALMDLQQDRQDAVNVLNTPDDECFHFVQGAPLINYLDVSSNLSLLVFLWQKKKKIIKCFCTDFGIITANCMYTLCALLLCIRAYLLSQRFWCAAYSSH